ncbi:MAG: alpha-2-macroglobulin family protein, partial [Victivallaceae bacterium]|nr:alpha-2-macroglobulin family protein [Victivallaceae bacterium]
LFVRPSNAGMINYAKLLNVSSAHSLEELKIRRSDMPNIFVEAVAVRNGKAYSVIKQIVVPPEKKILIIELKTAENKYKPGAKCPLGIKISDSAGKPVSGEVVLTVYDKALDIINGGGNIPEINSFFWKWTRHWYAQIRSSLDKSFRNVLKRNEAYMRPLGIFGSLPAPNMMTFGLGGVMRDGAALEKTKILYSPMAAAESAVAQEPAVVVRRNFADSILWKVALKTDGRGMAELPVPLPDNLTSWKIRAWVMTDKCSVGQGETEIVVSKDYLVRLILPRFLNTGDTATVSALVMNQGDKGGNASVTLEIQEEYLRLLSPSEQKVQIGAGGEKRLDWQVRAFKTGEAVITVKSFCGKESDAVELKLPVAVKGISKQTASSGALNGEKRDAAVKVDIPGKLRDGSAKLTVNLSPSVALALVDALPYLVNTGDKDIFSTVNRFIPALITRNTLKKLNVDLAEIEKSRTNLNPVELGGKKERASQWKRLKNNPVFSNKKVEEIVERELKNIAGMQNSDGGWGWFSAFYENSEVYTTVRTVRALLLAKDNGVSVEAKMLAAGINWLKTWQERRIEDLKEKGSSACDVDALVFDTLVKTGEKSAFLLEKLYACRSELSLNGITLLASACYRLNAKAKLQLLLKNIEQFIVEDAENQTAYLRLPENYCWWCWYGRDIDTQAEYLKLLAKVDPKGKRPAQLAKYILINRKHATYWTSVVDTGLCVEALCDFVLNSGEARPDMNIEVLYDGKTVRKLTVNSKNMFTLDNSVEIPAQLLTPGKHDIGIRREGKGTLYFNTYASYFTMEDFIKAAGLDLKVTRQYFKLVPVKAEAQARGGRGQALKLNAEKYKREAIKDYSEISSGDLIEIELTIESKNDYEYIVVDDGKPAGFEPVNVLSGYTGNSLGAFVEARDTLMRFYVRCLGRGRHSMSYRMRAVTPGRFSALPVIAAGVYAPELRCNSNEFNIIIR